LPKEEAWQDSVLDRKVGSRREEKRGYFNTIIPTAPRGHLHEVVVGKE